MQHLVAERVRERKRIFFHPGKYNFIILRILRVFEALQNLHFHCKFPVKKKLIKFNKKILFLPHSHSWNWKLFFTSAMRAIKVGGWWRSRMDILCSVFHDWYVIFVYVCMYRQHDFRNHSKAQKSTWNVKPPRQKIL